MLSSAMLDVVIGVLFVFILVSTLCAAIREGLEAWLKTRASYLEYAIRELLHDRSGTELAASFFNHPLIHGLYPGDYAPGPVGVKPALKHRGSSLPSYISSKSFALTLIDIAARGATLDATSNPNEANPISFDSLRQSVATMPNAAVRRVMLAAIDAAHEDLAAVQRNLEAWYDGAMERVSGWYKRTTQRFIFWIAFAVVAAMNINTITIADVLYRNDAVRAEVVATADKAQRNLSYAEASKSLNDLRLPIGWDGGWGAPRSHAEKQVQARLEAQTSHAGNPVPANKTAAASDNARTPFEFWNDLFAPILGLLMTAFAATLGAPFWFDVLNKVMVIRASIKPKKTSDEEASPSTRLAAINVNSRWADRIPNPPPANQSGRAALDSDVRPAASNP